jgi:hypothetical protein
MSHEELAALAKSLSDLARFCLSVSRTDKLHAEAIGDVVRLLDNLHLRVRNLEERMAALERRSQEEISISGRTIRVELPDPTNPDWPMKKS